MQRREFLGFWGAVAAWPLATRAQQSEQVRRVAVLMNVAADDPEALPRVGAFSQGLAELGWTIGRNVRIDYRWYAGNADAARKYATELVALAPDLILASGTLGVTAIQQITRSVPIVFTLVSRSSRRWFRQQLGAARRQRHWLHAVGIQFEREVAGTAQADRTAHDASGCYSGSD